MKINIYSKTKDGAWGGGNQFLKALKQELAKQGKYSDAKKGADAIIFNGYQDLWPIFINFFSSGKKKIVYRLGPILSLHRKGFRWKLIDRVVMLFANLFADTIIFQSKWSHQEALKFGFSKNKKFTTVLNSVDSSIFYKKEWREKVPGEKTRLVYTSWSANMKKGFAYLKFLDENLDFNKYEFTLIGNSPFAFKNIKTLAPLGSKELGAKLRESDVFISPVEDDACSNALIEGLASGLPVVALESGGNGEIVKDSGVLFKNEQELLTGIQHVANNLKSYYDRIAVKSLEEITEEYLKACLNI